MESEVLLAVLAALFLVGALVVWVLSYQQDSSSPIDRIANLKKKYSTKMGRFAARKEYKAAHDRAELAKELTFESEVVVRLNNQQMVAENATFDQAHNPERLDLNYQVETANFQLLLEQNQLTRQIIGRASRQDVDVPTYLELKKKIEMDRLDLDKQWQEAEQQLKAGFIYQMQAHQHLALMTEYIGRLYDRATHLEAEGKVREHRLIEEHIAFMEGDFRERQRLLQASNGEDLQGSDEDTDTSGNGTDPVQATQE